MRQAFYFVGGLVLGAGISLPHAAHADVPAATSCKMEAKIIELPTAHTSLGGFLSADAFKKLVNEKDVSILSVPMCTFRAKEPCTIGMTRDLKLADGSTRPVGVSLKIAPKMEKDSISGWRVTYKNTRLVGYTDATAKQPLYRTQIIHIAVGESKPSLVPPGQFQVFDLPPPARESKEPPLYDASGNLIEADKRQILLIRISRA